MAKGVLTEQEENVTVLIVMKEDFYFGLLYKPNLNKICKLKFVNSVSRASAEFESSKLDLDFVVFALHERGANDAETIEFSKMVKSDPEYKGKTIVTVFEYKQLEEKGDCDFACLNQGLVAFITPLIMEVRKVKQEERRIQNERSRNRVIQFIDSLHKKFA